MKDQLLEISRYIHERTKKLGITEYEFSCSSSNNQKIEIHNEAVEKLTNSIQNDFEFTIYHNKKPCSVSASGFEVIDKVIDDALLLSEFSAVDEYCGVCSSDETAKIFMDFDTYHPNECSLEKGISLAVLLEKSSKIDPKITNIDSCAMTYADSYSLYSNNHKIDCYAEETEYSLGINVVATNTSSSQTGSYWHASSKLSDLLDPTQIAKKAATQALAYLENTHCKTGLYPVIFTSETAIVIWSSLLKAINGSNIYQKSSYLLDKLGEQIIPARISITENPFIIGSLYSTNFDNDGVQKQVGKIVENGILKNNLFSCYYARKLKQKTTGNAGGVSNIMISLDDITSDDLIKKQHETILITELMSGGIDLISGNFSKGAKGFLIKDGEIQKSLHNITVAGNLKDMLQNIATISSDVDKRFNIQTGYMLINNMSISSSS